MRQYTAQIVGDVRIRIVNDSHAQRGEFVVTLSNLIPFMSVAIDFHRNTLCGAKEIDNPMANHMLASKFMSAEL